MNQFSQICLQYVCQHVEILTEPVSDIKGMPGHQVYYHIFIDSNEI